MESLGQNRVFENLQEKQERESIRAQKEQIKEEKKQAKDDTKSPLQKLVSYIELGGIILLVGVFRKPLELLVGKLFKVIDTEVIKVDEELKSDLINHLELPLRQLIISNYLEDPIQAYRFGGRIYREMVINGNWDTTIYAHLDSLPSTITPNFTIGTGMGSTNVTSNIVRGLSIQILGMLEGMIIMGADLMQ